MRKPTITFTLGLLLMILPQMASSQSRYIKTVEGEFEDVFFDLKDAIINKGLVIDNIGHVGKMLERTAEAVAGSTGENVQTYSKAKYLQFCSSRLTSKATSIDPRNLSICPFVVYVYETVKTPGVVAVGYSNPDFGNLDKSDPLSIEIHTFLKQLIDTTVEGY